jgi:hypothetical protein
LYDLADAAVGTINAPMMVDMIAILPNDFIVFTSFQIRR